jgi:hypothetical protein
VTLSALARVADNCGFSPPPRYSARLRSGSRERALLETGRVATDYLAIKHTRTPLAEGSLVAADRGWRANTINALGPRRSNRSEQAMPAIHPR